LAKKVPGYGGLEHDFGLVSHWPLYMYSTVQFTVIFTRHNVIQL